MPTEAGVEDHERCGEESVIKPKTPLIIAGKAAWVYSHVAPDRPSYRGGESMPQFGYRQTKFRGARC